MTSTRRVLWVASVVVGVALTATGVAVAVVGHNRSSGPEGAVQGYFDALRAADAPAALAWGPTAGGSTQLLTSAVLREQRRIAPITDLRISDTRRTGSTATVRVRYALRFADGVAAADTRVALEQHDGDWRLRRSTVQTQFVLGYASDRAKVLTAPVPQDVVQLFPGAAPISFDSPYLEITPSSAAIALDAGPAIDLSTQINAAGRAAISAAVDAKLRRCVTGPADPTCPVPDNTYVPGSLHGVVDRTSAYVITLDPSPGGLALIAATVPFTGSFRKLDFANRITSGTGTVDLAVHARAYVVAPTTVQWAVG